MAARQMILCAGLLHGLGAHRGAWRARQGAASDWMSPAMYLDIARVAEAGKLHAVFIADGITNAEEGTDRPCDSIDTATTLGLMAAVTSRVGLIGTGSTTYNQPYDLARRFATLDHLSGGRAGWNSVTTQIPAAAAMFGTSSHPDHDDRYALADEFIEVVFKLWDSWDDDALVGDKARGVFADPAKVRTIDHIGRYFQVKGPLPFPRPPQGRPVVFQAGSSSAGRDQAAKYADVAFTIQQSIEDAVAFRNDMHRRAEAHGRDPDHIKVLPGMSAVLGATEAEARQRLHRMADALGVEADLQNLARRVGAPIEALALDQPFPVHAMVPDAEFGGSLGYRQAFLRLARRDNATVRELLAIYGGGHQQVVGTAAQVADVMQAWVEAGACDGFNMMVDMLPDGVRQIVDLLVPELQARGLFHTDYAHATLRGNLGLGPAPSGAQARQPALTA